ncbi:hypothetical protein F2Q69_00059576 [Brassica cretica]|uniref:Uncharacterized protein n=1 Tax=Brassica cretica TaxID=69181 RepID=A0A8S9RIY0_BRACR|nr:hypothetical protein F2Q69_00059576 [Brassica cretica]
MSSSSTPRFYFLYHCPPLGVFSCFESMASEKFCPHLPTIIEGKHVEALYELWGIDYAFEIEVSDDDETPETLRPRYCGAYTSHFEDRGLLFPLPRFLLEALAELGMDFAQMAPNFFRYFLSSWIRAREEGLEFGLEELKQLFAIKRNSGFPGTMILAPRPGRSIIDGIPTGMTGGGRSFSFSILTRCRSVTSILGGSLGSGPTRLPFGSAPMTPELRGLIATLRRGSPRWLAFTKDRIRAAYALPQGGNRATPIGPAVPVRPGKGRGNKRTREKEALSDRPDESSEVGSLERAQKARRGPTLRSRSQAQCPGLLARLVSIAVPVGGARREPNTSTGSIGHPPPLRASGEGISQVDPSAHLLDVQETSSWRFSYDNKVPIFEIPESFDLIWRKIREKGCELPSLDDMRGRDAYVRMAIVSAKAMEASNEYAALMERRLADLPSKEVVGGHLHTIQQLRGELETVRVTEKQREVEVEGLKGKLAATEAEKVSVQNDLDLMKGKHRREIEGRDAAARKEHNLALRSLAWEYDAVLAVVKDKLQKKKEETAAEVRARIEALTEYIEGGFELEEELGHLRDREITLDLDYGVASVSDPSLSRLELPEVSGDSVDQE